MNDTTLWFSDISESTKIIWCVLRNNVLGDGKACTEILPYHDTQKSHIEALELERNVTSICDAHSLYNTSHNHLYIFNACKEPIRINICRIGWLSNCLKILVSIKYGAVKQVYVRMNQIQWKFQECCMNELISC